MKLLIVGKGGREHALAWKLTQSHKVDKIYVAPGNPGCELLANTHNVNLKTTPELLKFAKQNAIDLTIVGSEEFLVMGIVDEFAKHGLTIFGPHQKAAKLEGSKAYAKDFMNKYKIKTAHHQNFTDYANALKYLDQISYPIVIKASGLASGKGVIIAQNHDEAEEALASMLLEQFFGESGTEVVIEEYLTGVEASILAFTDGNVIVPLISAKDHKKIGDGETGPNTGGMGAIAPNPFMNEKFNQDFIQNILNPTLTGIKAEKIEFTGIIFFGLMLNENGSYLLEYNMRLGDPETQAILPLLETDLLKIIELTLNKQLCKLKLKWNPGTTCCVVLASGGYPAHYPKNTPIEGLLDFNQQDCHLFVAGVAKRGDVYVTSGGRVLNIVGRGKNLSEARARAYAAIMQIRFKNCYYRHDIGVS